jgi:hypothetical protein
MRKIESEQYVEESIQTGSQLQAQLFRMGVMLNAIYCMTTFIGRSKDEDLLTPRNIIFGSIDFIVTIIIGYKFFELQRDKQYLRVISAALKSDGNITIPGDKKDFDDSLEKRAKQYFKNHKRKEIDINNLF